MDEAFWEGMYRSKSAAWSGRPNPQLVTEAAGLVPGTALDIGCGEGADAVWLAERGWEVTAVDISPTALQRAQDRATDAGADVSGRITWVQADLTKESASLGTYDLVSAHFMQLSAPARDVLHRRLAAAVSLGGTLLVVGHHPSDLHAGVGRPHLPDLMFTAEQVAAVLQPDHWDVVVCESRPRSLTDDQGVERTVHDVVLNARRRI
ncbi:MAG: class I SAM-dependent methyltransferase [Geodermatophilaceae bacterium]